MSLNSKPPCDMNYFGYFLLLVLIFTCSTSCKKQSNGGPPKFITISRDSAAYNVPFTVTVDNFSPDKDTIKYNGVPCPIVSIQGSDISITIPKNAGPGYFTITDGTTIVKGFLVYYINTSYVTTIAGSLDSGSVDGTGLAASFLALDGVALSSTGILYTTEFTGGNQYIDIYSASSRIRQINAAGVVTTFSGSGHYGFKDGPASVAEFGELGAIAIDAAGNLYVTDYYYNRIRKITSSGDVSTIAGNGNAGFVDGPADSASFNGPTGIAIDNAGNVYVADNKNFAVRRISTNGMVTTLTSTGFLALTDPGQNHRTFASPWALYLNRGNLLLGDNGFIWNITPSGVLTVLAGVGPGYSEGPGYEVQFGRVEGLVADSHGNIYAADLDNGIIREITSIGVTNFAGIAELLLPAAVDGPWQTAIFQSPSGLAIDKDDNIYVADGYRLRKIFVQ
jgi:hypothetical protein